MIFLKKPLKSKNAYKNINRYLLLGAILIISKASYGQQDLSLYGNMALEQVNPEVTTEPSGELPTQQDLLAESAIVEQEAQQSSLQRQPQQEQDQEPNENQNSPHLPHLTVEACAEDPYWTAVNTSLPQKAETLKSETEINNKNGAVSNQDEAINDQNLFHPKIEGQSQLDKSIPLSVASYVEVFIKNRSGLKLMFRHDFVASQSKVLCSTPPPTITNIEASVINQRFSMIFPVLLDPQDLTVTLWQLQTILNGSQVGFWVQPQRILSEKYGVATFKKGHFSQITHNTAVWMHYNNDSGLEMWTRVVFDQTD